MKNDNVHQEWFLWKKSLTSKVCYREIIGSDLLEIKAQVNLSSSLSGFLLFLIDTDNIPNWLDNAKESKILKSIDENTHIFTTEFYGLWPIQPREMMIKSQYWQRNDLSIEIQIENAHIFDKKANTTLIDVISARWLITPIPDKKLIAEYRFIVDAKGNVPAWLVNRMTLKSTWQTLINIQQQLPHSKWQKSTLGNIKEMEN